MWTTVIFSSRKLYIEKVSSVGRIILFSVKQMWVISLCCVASILKLIFNVLAGGLHGDLGEDPESWNSPYIHLD